MFNRINLFFLGCFSLLSSVAFAVPELDTTVIEGKLSGWLESAVSVGGAVLLITVGIVGFGLIAKMISGARR